MFQTLQREQRPTLAANLPAVKVRDDFAALAAGGRLQWLPDIGVGFMDYEQEHLYGSEYWDAYRKLEGTPVATALNKARCALVARHWLGQVVDVGIGSGAFIEAHRNALGWDVNPYALCWLERHELLIDPRRSRVQAATFWDSLEHMRDPSEILDNVERWAFVSTPIYRDLDHVLSSKHLKPGEHLHYWEHRGLLYFMRRLGFEMRESNWMEVDAGRDGIGSFAFERVTPCKT